MQPLLLFFLFILLLIFIFKEILVYENHLFFTKISLTTFNINIVSELNKNPINNSTIYIYRAYLLKMTLKTGVTWKIRMTSFSNCFKDSNFASIFIENLKNGKMYKSLTFPTSKCHSKWAPKCYWGTWFIETDIPEEDVHNLGDKIKVHHNNRQIEVPLYKTPQRKPGLSICINTMYWYVDWPKIIEFIEIWKILGASHFYFYYQAITPEVDVIFKIYQEIGIITPIKSKLMQKSNDFDPNPYLYRLGFPAAQNDCLMRNEYKFMAMLDIDEIILPQKNITLYEWLEEQVKENPSLGAFLFSHAGLAFDGTKMLHFSSNLNGYIEKKEKFDWKKLDFSWLTTANYLYNYRPPKAINIPDHTNIIHTHGIKSMQWPWEIKKVHFNESIYYHTRIDWIASNISNIHHNEKTSVYNDRLKEFFNEDLRKTIHENYLHIMKRSLKLFKNNPDPHYEVIDILSQCLKDWRKIGCSPYSLCYANLSSIFDWIYANSSPDYEEDLYVL